MLRLIVGEYEDTLRGHSMSMLMHVFSTLRAQARRESIATILQTIQGMMEILLERLATFQLDVGKYLQRNRCFSFQ